MGMSKMGYFTGSHILRARVAMETKCLLHSIAMVLCRKRVPTDSQQQVPVGQHRGRYRIFGNIWGRCYAVAM